MEPVDLTLDVVFAGSGITAPELGYDDYAGIDVRGGRNEEHTPESQGAYPLTASRPDQLNLVGARFSPALTAVLNAHAPAAGLELSTKFDEESSMRTLFRCDHLPFLQKGIPAVWVFGGFHSGYHEPVDTVDRIEFTKLARAVRLAVSVVGDLSGPGVPPAFHAGP